jgi:hypothetical protein
MSSHVEGVPASYENVVSHVPREGTNGKQLISKLDHDLASRVMLEPSRPHIQRGSQLLYLEA